MVVERVGVAARQDAGGDGGQSCTRRSRAYRRRAAPREVRPRARAHIDRPEGAQQLRESRSVDAARCRRRGRHGCLGRLVYTFAPASVTRLTLRTGLSRLEPVEPVEPRIALPIRASCDRPDPRPRLTAAACSRVHVHSCGTTPVVIRAASFHRNSQPTPGGAHNVRRVCHLPRHAQPVSIWRAPCFVSCACMRHRTDQRATSGPRF